MVWLNIGSGVVIAEKYKPDKPPKQRYHCYTSNNQYDNSSGCRYFSLFVHIHSRAIASAYGDIGDLSK